MFTVENLLRYPMRSRISVHRMRRQQQRAAGTRSRIQRPLGHSTASSRARSGRACRCRFCSTRRASTRSATWVLAEGADAGLHEPSACRSSKLMDDAMIALYQNGERVRPENGYPMRLVVPGWEGNMNVKWLRRLKLADRAGDDAQRDGEIHRASAGRQSADVHVRDGREVADHVASPGQTMHGPEIYEIRGLAWSGRGRIAKVEVSADGGESWARSASAGTCHVRCFTRFRMPWQWDGKAAVLQEPRDRRDRHTCSRSATCWSRSAAAKGYFHYNAIVCWAIDEDGSIRHVYA